MEISRRGSAADHGLSSITLKDPSFAWSKINNTFTIKKGGVKDFSTDSRHNYTVSLTLDELSGLLRIVAETANAKPELFSEMSAQTLKSLLQIQSAIIRPSDK